MPIYAIGDVQGCYTELKALLTAIDYQPNIDQLWFCGDLVNRGPKSLETLRFIKSLPHCIVVLGNHDLHLLALAHAANPHKIESLENILTAPDCEELLAWLRQCPLLHYDPTLNTILVHAGIPPQWTLNQSQAYAREVEDILRGDRYVEFLHHMYGNTPALWDENLVGWDRSRCIINYLTRMRFCDAQGRLDLLHTGKPGSQLAGYSPWFEWPSRLTNHEHILFGHWSALNNNNPALRVHALDTGCVWGGHLTALRLEDNQRFCVKCKNYKNPKL